MWDAGHVGAQQTAVTPPSTNRRGYSRLGRHREQEARRRRAMRRTRRAGLIDRLLRRDREA